MKLVDYDVIGYSTSFFIFVAVLIPMLSGYELNIKSAFTSTLLFFAWFGFLRAITNTFVTKNKQLFDLKDLDIKNINTSFDAKLKKFLE